MSEGIAKGMEKPHAVAMRMRR
nr:hypothetical protein [Tanacetum cinerariifolium]